MIALNNQHRTDEEMMAGLAGGETRFLGDLYLRHGDSVVRFIDSLLVERSMSIAEDLCQEVFLTVNDKASAYNETGKLKSWIFGIAAKKARSWQHKTWLRRNLLRRHHTNANPTEMTTKGPHDSLEARDEISEILKRLTKGQREVLLLQTIEGLSGQEISEALGISLNAVWSRLKRAHHEIRDAGVARSARKCMKNDG